MIKCLSQAAPWTWKQNLLGSPTPLASARCQGSWLCGSFCLHMGVCVPGTPDSDLSFPLAEDTHTGHV